LKVDFSEITENLLIGTTPSRSDYEVLRQQGVRLVINMRFGHGTHPENGLPPLKYLWLHTFDAPLIPIPVRALVKGVHAALDVIDKGGKVYTHCARGRHRSVAMGAAILIAQGFSPETAMSLIKERRAEADPYMFYIRRRIMLFSRRWLSIS
jgi:dual specificity MAP kinase phosphatase